MSRTFVIEQNGASVATETDPENKAVPIFVAKQCGVTTFSLMDGEMIMTRIACLVKTDTRELEFHLKQQFPTAKVTITSVGTNSLMLQGTVASDDDSRGIVELTEQFAPKVINRLKVGAGERAVADDARRMGAPARPIELTVANDLEETGNPPKADHPPKRITPAAAKAPKKSEQLQQLRDEIRELRQEVRELIQRLDREQAATPKTIDDAKRANKLGRTDLEFTRLILEFNELMECQRFVEAEVIAKQAIELDPDNPLPQTMLFKAKLARRNADNEKQRPATTTQPRPMSEAAKAEPLSLRPAVAGLTEAERAAVEKLNANVKLEASDLPLRKVIQQLAASADVNIVLDKAGLEEAGVTAETPVSRTLQGVKLRSALKIVLEPLQLGYVFDGEVLKITSRERAEGPPVVVPYPVADLLGKGPISDELKRLRDLIMVTLRGERDWLEGNASIAKIHCDGATKSLLVRHTRSLHAELATFLELLRQTKRSTESANGRSTSHLSDEERRIADQLRTQISLSFDNAPLKEALGHVAKDRGFNIVLDSAGLEDEGLKPTTPVSISLAQVQTSTALRLLLEPLQLDYVVKNEVLQVTSRQRAAGELVVATYPVGSLLWRKDQNGQPDEQSDLSELCDLLMSMVEPNSWENVGGIASVRGNGATRSLVVRQSRANHARIRELLETLGKLRTEKTTANSPGKRVGHSWEDIANRRGKYALPEESQESQLIAKTYSVADLVVPVQPVHLRFRVDDNKAEPAGLDKPVPPANSLAQLLEMITSTIAPDSWEEAGGNGQMTANDSTLSLVVRQTPAVHDELRSLLDLLRKLPDQ